MHKRDEHDNIKIDFENVWFGDGDGFISSG
jgi:hypothetical protein